MATILLSTVGAAIGGTFGGTVLGLTGAAVGKAIGASLGGAIDQKLLGTGSRVVETGRIESFRLQGVTEGAAVPRVMGRARIAGHLIWSSKFLEKVESTTSGGGKGVSGPEVTTQSYSYCVSLAFALGEGVIERVGRIWADGQEISREGLPMVVYRGDDTQLPDPTISAIEGLENTPGYRGTAYVVFEGLDLSPFGNRIPQFNFEVFRKAQPVHHTVDDPAQDIRGVNLIPGTGEYALATTRVEYPGDFADGRWGNVNSTRGETDLLHALEDLRAELPQAQSVSLVVSWFGDDLRCGDCTLTPRVEQTAVDGVPMPWVVSGQARSTARTVSQVDERPVFGGTPADAAVLEAIQEVKDGGQRVVFYPFILMDIQRDNGLGDPYSDNADQPVMPWRGRITGSAAPGRPATPDQTPAAADEVASFFGSAAPDDFAIVDGDVVYSGPAEWSYRRFILHYAWLCKLAGGIEAFNIGSEMRGLTQLRDAIAGFPAVVALRTLAADVRAVLGPDVKIGYAADWSEYFGYHPGNGDVFFHLDPLWSAAEIDYVGVDNYMPIADWRDEFGHADEGYGSTYALDYLRANIAGGEGYDWYYPTSIDRDAQARVPITDGAFGEPWVFRYKDLVNWWRRPHYNRIGGERLPVPTSWAPEAKPIRFTELGCPAVDKAANQPNVFYDPLSSESALPYYSDGSVDGFMQAQYLRATYAHWSDPTKNPTSDIYFGPMVDLENSHVWAWDSRPWPEFPTKLDVWLDGGKHARGHWLTGRFNEQPLAAVVAEICELSGLTDIDVSELYGTTAGVVLTSIETARQALQPLMLAYDFTCFEESGKLVFRNRSEVVADTVAAPDLVILTGEPVVSKTRAPEAETAGRVRVSYWDETRDYQTGASEFVLADDDSPATNGFELPVVLRPDEGQAVASRALAAARVARDELKIALPPSHVAIAPGDVLKLADGGTDATYRVERIEEQGARVVEAQRIEQSVYKLKDLSSVLPSASRLQVARGVHLAFLDLPLLRADQASVAPRVAATSLPFPRGGAAVFSSATDEGFSLNSVIETPSQFGVTRTALAKAAPGRWHARAHLRVRLSRGALQSRTTQDVLGGANVIALGDGSAAGWEILQFQEAELQGDGDYILRELLRGQLGTDADMPAVWASGSQVVVLDRTLTALDLDASQRGLERQWRYGPAALPASDGSYATRTEAFDFVALRPLSPVHLRAFVGGSLQVTWVRRTRVDGDSWQGLDVPLG
ncbi:MAG: glycoside hydrolase TIM-barrel-like domain-containing protein, partial [Pseudomonadota bacterium]